MTWSGDFSSSAGSGCWNASPAIPCRRCRACCRNGRLGCPLNNLGQEMAPLDGRFRQRVSATFETWVDGFAKVLAQGQREGTVRKDVDARRFATFLVAAIEGSFGLAKSSGSKAMLRSNL